MVLLLAFVVPVERRTTGPGAGRGSMLRQDTSRAAFRRSSSDPARCLNRLSRLHMSSAAVWTLMERMPSAQSTKSFQVARAPSRSPWRRRTPPRSARTIARLRRRSRPWMSRARRRCSSGCIEIAEAGEDHAGFVGPSAGGAVGCPGLAGRCSWRPMAVSERARWWVAVLRSPSWAAALARVAS